MFLPSAEGIAGMRKIAPRTSHGNQEAILLEQERLFWFLLMRESNGMHQVTRDAHCQRLSLPLLSVSPGHTSAPRFDVRLTTAELGCAGMRFSPDECPAPQIPSSFRQAGLSSRGYCTYDKNVVCPSYYLEGATMAGKHDLQVQLEVLRRKYGAVRSMIEMMEKGTPHEVIVRMRLEKLAPLDKEIRRVEEGLKDTP